MARKTITVDSVGEAYLALLADRGVDYLFGNAGTDFPPIIEALSKALTDGAGAPKPVTVPHENLALSMAHGYYMVSGRPQAVMCHVNVGTANAVCALMNAARGNVPVLFTAGRTPINEDGVRGARTVFIHWGQEMFDQASLVREFVKWDYELRGAEQLETVVDRALSIAMSEPRGPVYLSLPREVLAEAPGEISFDSPTRRHAASPPAPDAAALAQAADMLAAAENPLIVSGEYGRAGEGVAALAELAERFALPVVCYRPRHLALPTGHPMLLGYEAAPFLADADVVVVLDCDVPWLPNFHKLNPAARVIHIASDPLYSRYPIRGFPADLAITGAPVSSVAALADALGERAKGMAGRVDARRKRLAERWQTVREGWRAITAAGESSGPATKEWIAHCLDRAKGDDDLVVAESQLPLTQLSFPTPGTYFGMSTAGGLGWGLGAALGAKLAAPDRVVFTSVGDGSYMFGGPTPAHYVSAAMELPTVTIIINNGMWGSVRKATLGMYPDGAAARMNRAPLTVFEPVPEYERIVEACGGYGEKVENAADLPAALDRAIAAVTVDKRQAVLNVMARYEDDQALAEFRR